MNCRSCNGYTHQIFTLGKIPLVNSLLDSPEDLYEKYPIDVMLCKTCLLGQLSYVVPPKEMFKEYLYYSSVSGPIVEASKLLVDRASKLLPTTLPDLPLVVEIGSNDGYLLQFYKEKGISVLGVDPATGPANAAALKGIPTVQEFFSLKVARKLPKADIIHANNVMAHVPDLNDFVAGLAELLKPEGVGFIEVHSLNSLLEKCEFDTVYHEHSYYFSFRSLETLFSAHGLCIEDAELLSSQGGSFRITLKKKCAYPILMEEDIIINCSDIQRRIGKISSDLVLTLLRMKKEGKKVWGYGAAAKATVMMNYCEITDNLIGAVADPAPAKIGKYIPGTGVQIRSPEDWLESQPDYTCIFAWNYAQPIAHQYAQSYKGKFFTPYTLHLASGEEICKKS